jgi:hypothetical protein
VTVRGQSATGRPSRVPIDDGEFSERIAKARWTAGLAIATWSDGQLSGLGDR